MADRSRWSDAAYVIPARGASREVLPVRGGTENSPAVYRILRDYEGAVEAREVGGEVLGNTVSEAVRGLASDLALIDGEAAALRDDGRSDFHALLTKRGGAQASLIAFDLLRLDCDDLGRRPIEERPSALLKLVVGVNGILFSETTGPWSLRVRWALSGVRPRYRPQSLDRRLFEITPCLDARVHRLASVVDADRAQLGLDLSPLT